MTALSLACLVLAGAGILYLGLAAILAFRLAGQREPVPASWPAVTILKPLHGDEPGLFENLESFIRQDYPGPVQILLGIQRPDDPALAIAEALVAAHPGRDIALVVDARHRGTNRKVSNLANLTERAVHPVIVLADSDMRVGSDYLSGVVARLSRPGIGAVSCPYHGLPVPTFWARLSGLAIDSHFLPGVATAAGLGLAHPCLGSTIALRRETLDRIGGFAAFADALADDHALGARVRALGLQVALTSFSVGHVCPERSFGQLLRQELRWVRTIRQVEPAGHLGSVLSHPLAFALMGVALAPSALAGAFVAAAIGARIGLCLAVERAFGLKPHPYWLVPMRDCLSILVYAASFLGRRVSWRGDQFDVTRAGALLPRSSLPPAPLPETTRDAS